MATPPGKPSRLDELLFDRANIIAISSATKIATYPNKTMVSHARTTKRPTPTMKRNERSTARSSASRVSHGLVKPVGKRKSKSPSLVTRRWPRYSCVSQ